MFKDFEKSKYADGSFFDKYTTRDWLPTLPDVERVFQHVTLPTRDDWAALKADVLTHGLYNRNLQAVPPTGSNFPPATSLRSIGHVAGM